MKSKKSNYNILKSSLIFSSFTLFSRILGFIRDMVTANLLGANVDVFLFAQRIPNLFRRLFAEGSFSQAFVPIFAKYHSEHDNSRMRALAASAAGWLMLITLTITILGIVFSGYITYVLAHGWEHSPQKYEQASFLLKITFPYLFFVSMVALSGSIFNVLGKVALFSFTPAILNVSLIVSALFLPNYLHIDTNLALALGVFFGGLVQLLIQLPFLYKRGFLVMPSLKIVPGLGRMFKNMLPTIIGASGAQINMLVNTSVATFLVAGSISYLYYAERLLEFPLGIFGVAISTILLPTLSRKVKIYQAEQTEQSRANYLGAMDWGIQMIILISVPCWLFLGMMGKYFIDILFTHGHFNTADLFNTNMALIAFSFSVVPSMLTKTLSNGFYAHEDTKTPMYISLSTIGLNIILNLSVLHLGQFWGLAAATSFCSFLNMVLLFAFLRRKNYYYLSTQTWHMIVRATIAGLGLFLVLFFLPTEFEVWLKSSHFWTYKLPTVLFYGFVGCVVYLGLLVVMGVRFRHIKYVEKRIATLGLDTTSTPDQN